MRKRAGLTTGEAGARLGISQSKISRIETGLYEPALRVPVGGPAVLATQLRHLADLARRPRITIQVVPLAAGPHPGLEGSFVVMGFAGDPTLVYLENRATGIFLEEDPHIESYRLAWQRIPAKALSPERSILITQMAKTPEGSRK